MKTLVLGASTNPERYAYKAIAKLKQHGYTLVALGIKEGVVLGETIETTPQFWSDIDTVTLYVGPARQAPYLDYLKELSPRRIIFNPGTENPTVEKALAKQRYTNRTSVYARFTFDESVLSPRR